MQPIILSDGTELIPLEPKDKEALELEIKAILDKYNASYLPIIKEEKSITGISTKAGLLLLRKREHIESTNPEVNPLIDENNGENKEEKSETPEAN